ncbi:MFS transporter [Chryseobacterium culicis]|uniref:Predicted arabinose efflux permease, MFS family n=1 Tax=Chryseobacterium culicis TaxID=680127 RepID=A0A1H6INJ8_CHRCI|nr:MFS transporter [Chryseobacterium culicis]SEH47846.1 Predicted arabinose efflux permease, MFS family [Chryseobacterium culicis]
MIGNNNLVVKETLIENKPFSKGLIFLLALAAGVSVANLYYNQPLLGNIADEFHIDARRAGLLSTLTQLGYASGVFLFVPLGDIKDKRSIILILICFVTLSLLGVALVHNLILLYILFFCVGLTTGIPQIIVPFAAQLAPPKNRGKVIGTVVSAALIGILLARTVSGYVGYWFGWRYMFVIASVAMAFLGTILYFKLPANPPTVNLHYGDLMKSLRTIYNKYPSVKTSVITGGSMFGAFSIFWTSLTFLLESPIYDMNSNQIGLFGLIGAIGAVGARVFGSLNDKMNSRKIISMAAIICALSFLVLYPGKYSMITFIIAGVVILDFGMQGTLVSTQAIIYSLNDGERSRINTIFVVSNFIGGAIGSAFGSLAWSYFGWSGVCLLGFFFVLIALIANIKGERNENLKY